MFLSHKDKKCFYPTKAQRITHQEGIVISPDPNYGAFSIQFNQITAADTKVVNSDMPGRIVEEFEMGLNFSPNLN